LNATSISLIPPGTGGVRDYASVLGKPFRSPLLEFTRDTDTSKLSGDFALLHFSGYGFQTRGVPAWLVGQVRTLRSRFETVGIVFHELFATGPIWGSAFWLNGLQKRIARELARSCDFWLTNRDESARWLLEQGQSAPHRVLPVFSNVGEPDSVDGPRAPRIVVFGSAAVRRNVYEWADGEIFRAARRIGLEIHDIGPSLGEGPLAQRLADEKAVSHGKLPVEAVSRALSGAAYGALAYPTDYVSKSSVFAAYTAHGLCPVLLAPDYASHDGLRPNVHYAAGFESLAPSCIDARGVGRAARLWYEPHCIEAHVGALRTLVADTRRAEMASS